MTGQQLKNSILQLAIQGKLVPQDANDEPASKLLKRIKAEKERLVKAKAIKKEKPLDEISDDEKPFEIPEGWEWCYMGELFMHNNGKQLNKGNAHGTMMDYITTSNLYWDYFVLDSLKQMPFEEEEIDRCQAIKGDLLICEGGDIGRASIWNYDTPIMLQNHIHKCRAYLPLCTKFYYYVFFLYNKTGQIGGKGIGIQGFSSGALHKTIVPLPPLSEQYRIVSKLEQLLPLVDEYGKSQEALDKLNAELPDKLRQSILQDAIQGKLGTQDPNDEPASVLLRRIRDEKEKLIKAKAIKKDKPLPPTSDDEKPFEIPEGWEWVRHNELFEISGGSQPPKSEFSTICTNDRIRLYQIRDYGESPQPIYIKKEKASKITKKGDILLARYGGSLGKVFWAEDGAYNVALAKVIPLFESKLIDKNFMFYYYHTSLYRNVIFGNSRSAQGGFNKEDLDTMLIPLPPFQEQHRIVEKLNTILPHLKSLNNI